MLYYSLFITLSIRYAGKIEPSVWNSHLRPFSLLFIVWLLIFYIGNLYNLRTAVTNSSFLTRTLQSTGLASIISIIFFYANPSLAIAPKTNLLIFVFVFSIFFLLWRSLFNFLLKSYLPQNNIAFIGYNQKVADILGDLSQKPHLGYNPAFVYDDTVANFTLPEKVKRLTDVNGLRQAVAGQKISKIVIVSDIINSEELRNALFACISLKIDFISLPHFYEAVSGKIPLELLTQMWFLENLSEGSKTGFDSLKRFYDLAFSAILSIVTLPLWPLILLAIRLDSPGSPIYTQERTGKNGRVFTMYKFRTMATIGNDSSPTKEKDQRVTRVGNFLRRTRIDEIPQMINIIKGEMSFVGPRPERPHLVEELAKAIPFYRERLLVKPGVTGWDQISGEYHSPSVEDTVKKLQYDLFYIKNRSLYLDFSIILKTIATVISRAGR